MTVVQCSFHCILLCVITHIHSLLKLFPTGSSTVQPHPVYEFFLEKKQLYQDINHRACSSPTKKCTIQQFLVYLQSCITITTVYLRTFYHPTKKLCTHQQSFTFLSSTPTLTLGITNMIFVSLDLPVLCIPFHINGIIYGIHHVSVYDIYSIPVYGICSSSIMFSSFIHVRCISSLFFTMAK